MNTTTKATKHLQLPFQFDVTRLVNDLNLLLDTYWIPHFNTNGYTGDWNSIALYAKDGDMANIFALNVDGGALEATPALEASPYFQEVLSYFKCSFLSVRLLRLGAGATIEPHRDYELGYEDGTFRLHIPIITNSQVDFMLDGERVVMKPGTCWYTNVNYVHSVANRGAEDRVHLVIDGECNAWSDELFFSLRPKASFFPVVEERHSKEQLKMMIAELERMEGPGAEELLLKLQQDI